MEIYLRYMEAFDFEPILAHKFCWKHKLELPGKLYKRMYDSSEIGHLHGTGYLGQDWRIKETLSSRA
jgi:hypothetical protein